MRELYGEEGWGDIESTLDLADSLRHPFHANLEIRIDGGLRPVGPKPSGQQERPIEEIKREEARDQKKPFRVPEWWKGEEEAGRLAMAAAKIVPKNIGQQVK